MLIVCNRVKNAQEQYNRVKEKYNVPILLLHSRFKRGDRNQKEKQLIGLDDNGIANVGLIVNAIVNCALQSDLM